MPGVEAYSIYRALIDSGRAARILSAADRCFAHFENGNGPESGFSPISTSVRIPALRDFGCDAADLLCPLEHDWPVDLEHSWVRKRFAPALEPVLARPNGWHQDGGLGVLFHEPGAPPPMTRLLTCWIALEACDGSRPSLEFVNQRLEQLLHYTELDDTDLRQRFNEDRFTIPVLDPGDAVLFPGGTLHRTWQTAAMTANRVSVEYRLFPPTARRRSFAPASRS